MKLASNYSKALKRIKIIGMTYSVKTERSYRFYLLHIPTGEYIAFSYTKAYMEYFIKLNINKSVVAEYEIVDSNY